MIRAVLGSSLAVLLLVLLAAGARAEDSRAIQRAIDRGVDYLKSTQRRDGSWPHLQIGATALAGLTLLECGLPADDPAVQRAAEAVREEAPGCLLTYSLALSILFLDRLGNRGDESLIETMAIRLLAGQDSNGGWTYMCPDVEDAELRRLKGLFRQRTELVARGDRPRGGTTTRPVARDPSKQIQQELARIANRQPVFGRMGFGDDNSNTQFAILGLWAARRHGVPVEFALDRVRTRFRNSQNSDGGWGYHYSRGGRLSFSTSTMTCAGLLGLACALGSAHETALRTAKAGDGRRGSGQPVSDPEKDPAIRRGLLALGTAIGRPAAALAGKHDVMQVGPHGRAYYFLWSLERVAVAYGLKTIGNKDWYAWGAQILLANQEADGSWQGAYSQGGADTCFALLFLRRANLTKDLTSSLKGKIEDPGESVLRGGGFGGGKIGEQDAKPKLNANDQVTGEEPGPPMATKPAKGPARAAQAEPARPTTRPAPSAPPAPAPEGEAARLGNELLQAPAAVQKAMLVRFRDSKGGAYTAALADAIPKLGQEMRNKAREMLAERLTRMTAATLADKLQDDNAEIRRAAALACALKQENRPFPRLIDLLQDREPEVARAAHLALKSLAGEDFGPTADASPAERAKAIAAWKAWWEKRK